MKLLSKIKSFFRGYSQLASPSDGTFTNWQIDAATEEQDVWRNAYALTARMRSLARENEAFTKYHWTLMASVFSETGLMLRMQVKETDDRKIDAKEKKIVRDYEARINRVRKWAAKKLDREFEPFLLTRESDEDLTRAQNGSGIVRKATIKVGAPDLGANQLIMAKWKEWSEAQYCDAGGRRNYALIRHLRLWSAVRDGEIFIRTISHPKVNKFGFAIQLINAEYCDRFFNGTTADGNEVRQGIEYKIEPWGLGKPVAYYFITRTPNDWQWVPSGALGFAAGVPAARHTRIPAEEIIHYARPVDADSTRPAPWAASCIPTAKHLSDFARHAVVAARESCMRLGWMESTLTPDAADIAAGEINQPSDSAKQLGALKPGSVFGLPPFVTYKTNSPEHPTTTFSDFFDAQGRLQCAGMPGSNYSEIFNDYAAINFSAGRLQRLCTDGVTYLIQRFDIDAAEIPIFRRWLYMSLVTGEIPLPLDQFDKYNQPFFQGPKTPGVDEVKDINAAAFRIANHVSNWTIEAANEGFVWEEVILVKAENIMLMEEYGMDSALTASKPMPVHDVGAASEDETTVAKSDEWNEAIARR